MGRLSLICCHLRIGERFFQLPDFGMPNVQTKHIFPAKKKRALTAKRVAMMLVDVSALHMFLPCSALIVQMPLPDIQTFSLHVQLGQRWSGAIQKAP